MTTRATEAISGGQLLLPPPTHSPIARRVWTCDSIRLMYASSLMMSLRLTSFRVICLAIGRLLSESMVRRRSVWVVRMGCEARKRIGSSPLRSFLITHHTLQCYREVFDCVSQDDGHLYRELSRYYTCDKFALESEERGSVGRRGTSSEAERYVNV